MATKNPDAVLAIQNLEGVVKDNFQKLNRLFSDGAFQMKTGKFTTAVGNMNTTVDTIVIYYHRIGHLITLQFDRIIDAASKTGAGNPGLVDFLPPFLCPNVQIDQPAFILDNAAFVQGTLKVTQTGVVTWERLSGAWTAAVHAAIYPIAISYLGN